VGRATQDGDSSTGDRDRRARRQPGQGKTRRARRPAAVQPTAHDPDDGTP